ncbi:MAG: hypothetical protein SGJ00_07795 [bacterium]|nr:hypothetical protein [bacterium]
MLQFCSITSSSHLYKTYALAESLAVFGFSLHVLVIDSFNFAAKPHNVKLYPLQELVETELGAKMLAKYKHKSDKLRWGLKSVFLLHLLNDFEKIVYVDNDIYFYGDPVFVSELLDKHAVVLTPHFYLASSEKEQNWLEASYRVGLYNAGFMGVNRSGAEALEWWANCCLYNLKKAYQRGLFDDQKYLDLMPIEFDDVYVLKNKGYNLAGWNASNYELKRDLVNRMVKINEFDLVFIHFAHISLTRFSRLAHPLHEEYEKYVTHLKKFNPSYNQNSNKSRWYEWAAYLNYVKWNLLRLFE